MKTVFGAFAGMLITVLIGWATETMFLLDWKMITFGAIIGAMGIHSTDTDF